MRTAIRRLVFGFIVIGTCCCFVASETKKPVREAEILALVAGDTLADNVVNEITARGLGFRPDARFISQLKAAGADSKVLAAVESVGKSAQNDPQYQPSHELLEHLAAAGKFIADRKFEPAGDELTQALKYDFERSATGFIMARLLGEQDHWDQAAALLREVVDSDPDFPEAHTHFSYALHRIGQFEEALREAKMALARTPNNVQAHCYAGIALDDLGRRAAAEAEYLEALRIKPDFAVGHYDFGVSLDSRGEKDKAISEYRKALALHSELVDARYNLANLLAEKHQFDLAISEYRHAKRSAPERFDIRANLGSTLINAGMYAEAVREYRELETMRPDSAMVHQLLGEALYMSRDFSTAEKEYHRALQLDASDEDTVLGLGAVYEEEHRYDAALQYYREAIELDEDSPYAHRNAGRVLLTQRNVAAALQELKQAMDLAPSKPDIHDLYGQALQLSGDLDAAAKQFVEALALDPGQVQVVLELAEALEKKGDWLGALDQYKRAAQLDFYDRSLQPQKAKRIYGAEQKYNEALRIADQLQPRDVRLITTLNHIGQLRLYARDFDKAQVAFERQLKTSEEFYGSETPASADAFKWLAVTAGAKKDWSTAKQFLDRTLEINRKLYGENSTGYTEALRTMGGMYMYQAEYERAEPFLAEAAAIEESLYHYDAQYGPLAMINLSTLCELYNRWGNAEKLEGCDRRMIKAIEKGFGSDTPYLEPTLTREAKTLRTLGRTDEADRVEKRLKALHGGSSTSPN